MSVKHPDTFLREAKRQLLLFASAPTASICSDRGPASWFDFAWSIFKQGMT